MKFLHADLRKIYILNDPLAAVQNDEI